MGILASANPPPLPGFLSSLAGPLDHYGYLFIALLLLLENIGIPVVPGEFALIAGAIFAGTGQAGLNVVLVGVIAVIVVVVGAEIGYYIGRFAGRELILRYGKYVLLRPEHLDRAEAIVSRYGGFVVVIARFIVGLREANGIIAGITQMRWLTFLIFNVIGACAWVGTWVTLGYVAGDHIATIYVDINRYFLYLLIALVVLLAGYVGWRRLRRRRVGQPHEAADTQEHPEASIPAPENAAAGEALGTAAASETPAGSEPEEEEEEAVVAEEVPGVAAEVPGAADVPGAGERSPAADGPEAADGSGAGEEAEGQQNSRSLKTQPKSS
jgi:membrane protein DedA with SNARE-associated domain